MEVFYLAKITVSKKGQIVIPSKIRHKLGIEEGSKIEITEKGGRLILIPQLKNPIMKLRGKYQGEKLTDELLRERRLDEKRSHSA